MKNRIYGCAAFALALGGGVAWAQAPGNHGIPSGGGSGGGGGRAAAPPAGRLAPSARPAPNNAFQGNPSRHYSGGRDRGYYYGPGAYGYFGPPAYAYYGYAQPWGWAEPGYGPPPYPPVARCLDGSISYDPNYPCWRHGGVRYWY